MNIDITENIKYIGVDDKTIDLFESQYIVPNGISYNSYVIFDEKIVIMDTVDKRATDEWLKNLENALKGKNPDYLVVSHLEPDHSANIELIAKKYPNLKIIVSNMAANMLPQFCDIDLKDRIITVKEAETLDIGKHKLKFLMAPMVHWPEVMFTYDTTDKILFSADAFGKFGALDTEEDWACEARRYYFNIVGKYGIQVQAVLKKAEKLDISMICPLHGPILKENLEYYINKYDIWSSYKPEDEGVVIAFNSIYGNTKNAVDKLAQILEEKDCKKVSVFDLSRDDMAEAVEDAFRYNKMVIATPTYDAGLLPKTEEFLGILKHKNYQNRKVGIIENGSWSPMAAKCVTDIFENMKNIEICKPIISIKTRMNDDNIKQLNDLAEKILED